MLDRRRTLPLVVFVIAYLLYATTLLAWPGTGTAGRVLSLPFLGAMIGCVIWARRRQDEVMRGVADRATHLGFWVGFVTLYVGASFPSFAPIRNGWPLWTAPLLAWVAGYGWSLWRLR